MKKQTAVEWLEEKLKENLKHIVLNGDYVLMKSIFLQAKEMERQEMLKLISFVRMNNKMGKSADDLLKEFETYKRGEQ